MTAAAVADPASAAPAGATAASFRATPTPTPASPRTPDPAPGPSPAPRSGKPTPASPPARPPAGVGVGGGAARPTPTPTPTAPVRGPISGSGGTGLFDVAGHIRDAINGWFNSLVRAALDPVLRLLARTVLASPAMGSQPRIHSLWLTSLVVTDSLYGLLILAGGIVVMTHETLQTRYALREIAPRLVVGFIAANASLSLVDLASTVVNAITEGLLGQGVDPTDAAGQFFAAAAGIGTGSIFVTLLGLVLAVLAVTILVSYVVRVALMVLLSVGGPLALSGWALPQTDAAARLWGRALVGCYTIQLGQALVLITGIRVFFSAGVGPSILGFHAGDTLVSVLVSIALLYVMVRIPAWVVRAVFRPRHGSTVVRLVRYRLIYQSLRRIGVV